MYTGLAFEAPLTYNKADEGIPTWAAKAKNAGLDQAQYFGMVKCIDDNVGKILEYLRENQLMDNTIVVFTADHGDLRGEHGRQNKGVPYEGSAKIPFVIRWPKKIKAGTVVPQALDCTAFLPTILALMDTKTAGKEQGRDASELFTQAKTPAGWDDIVFMRAAGTSDDKWVAAVTSRYKLIYCAKDEPWFFDLEKDPDELVNNYMNASYRDVIVRMASGLREYGKKYNDPRISNEKVAADIARSIEKS